MATAMVLGPAPAPDTADVLAAVAAALAGLDADQPIAGPLTEVFTETAAAGLATSAAEDLARWLDHRHMLPTTARPGAEALDVWAAAVPVHLIRAACHTAARHYRAGGVL